MTAPDPALVEAGVRALASVQGGSIDVRLGTGPEQMAAAAIAAVEPLIREQIAADIERAGVAESDWVGAEWRDVVAEFASIARGRVMSGQASVDTWLAENYPGVMTMSPSESALLDTVRRLGDEADQLVTERDQARAVADALAQDIADVMAENRRLRDDLLRAAACRTTIHLLDGTRRDFP